jgi:iron complex transport system ATP-binding protein
MNFDDFRDRLCVFAARKKCLKFKTSQSTMAKCAVVQNITLALETGKIIALLGANGAGKTTLLKTLNASLPVVKGAIMLDGKSIENFVAPGNRPKNRGYRAGDGNEISRQRFGVCFSRAFRPRRGFRLGNRSGFTDCLKSLEACDLRNYENRSMNQLSGGERQRVVLARALATEAEILLLDEPTANLDLAHQSLLFRLVKERCVTSNAAAIVITHDLNLASEFADEFLLLKNGKIIAKGKPETVLTGENLQTVFGVNVLLDENPVSKKMRVTALY